MKWRNRENVQIVAAGVLHFHIALMLQDMNAQVVMAVDYIPIGKHLMIEK
ncbi:hypothetical protein MHI39_15100 [Heyndrickxia sp. FSL K6-6286]